MIRSKKKNSLTFLPILLLVINLSAQEVNLFTKEKIEEYAQFLLLSNQYAYAAEEYERLVFMEPVNESYQVGLLRAYRLGAEYRKGLTVYEHLRESNAQPGFELVKEYSKLSLLDGNMQNLQQIVSNKATDYDFRNNLDLTMRLLSHPEYDLNLEGLDQGVLDKGLLDLYDASQAIHYKSRFLAGSLSALIPGLGKVYTGRWQDGLISFLFVTSTGFTAYRAFTSDKGLESIYGWIMGGVSLGFYIGNVYGSAKSARIYNTNQNNRYREKVLNHYIDSY